MIDNNLDLTSLRKVVKSFETSLNVFENFAGSKNEIEVIKAGVIQNFKFCYELSWKFIKRWLMMNVSSDIADGVTRRELFRLGVENRLIENIEDLMEFHVARNKTSHIYDEEIADRVFNIAKKFLPYTKFLLKNLEAKNDWYFK